MTVKMSVVALVLRVQLRKFLRWDLGLSFDTNQSLFRSFSMFPAGVPHVSIGPRFNSRSKASHVHAFRSIACAQFSISMLRNELFNFHVTLCVSARGGFSSFSLSRCLIQRTSSYKGEDRGKTGCKKWRVHEGHRLSSVVVSWSPFHTYTHKYILYIAALSVRK